MKTALVTGANAGMGYETAKALVAKGYVTTLACRDVHKAQKARDRILAEYPGSRIEVAELDLADLDSVRALGKKVREAGEPLDVLCNNAGLMACPEHRTKEGYEMQLAVNHLGHFLLTSYLLPLMMDPKRCSCLVCFDSEALVLCRSYTLATFAEALHSAASQSHSGDMSRTQDPEGDSDFQLAEGVTETAVTADWTWIGIASRGIGVISFVTALKFASCGSSKPWQEHLASACTGSFCRRARIVNVSSSAHLPAKMRFEDLQFKNGYSRWGAYSQSKLANILFTYELARRLPEHITANALHPGIVDTGLMRYLIDMDPPWWKVPLQLPLLPLRLFLKSPQQGASTQIYLCLSPEVEKTTGKYFVDSKETKSSAASYDVDAAKQLWATSLELTGTEEFV